MTRPRFKRILLKLSGEALMGSSPFGIDQQSVADLAAEVKAAKAQGYELCLVIGGGNIFRGMAGAAKGMDRAQADYMGMLATVMNALAMQNALEQIDVETRVQSAIKMDQVCEPVIRRRAERHLAKGRVVIFAAGVGSPYFTTDTGAALRAAEMKCDALFKGTSVDGVYDSDPKTRSGAKRYDSIGLRSRSRRRPQGDGRRGGRLVPRQRYPDRRVQHPPAGQPCRACSTGTGPRRSSRTRSETMPSYDKADLQRRMHGAVEALKHDLGGLRTGRASTALLDPVQVEVYGSNMPLNQLATVSVPEPRLLSVQVWDKSNVGPVEKAIRSAGLGLNPITDGQLIRLPIPDLTEERRKELAKLCGQYAEKARIAVRNVRRDGMDHLKADEKKKDISEDEHKRLDTEVQKLTDDTIKEIDSTAHAKEQEILGR